MNTGQCSLKTSLSHDKGQKPLMAAAEKAPPELEKFQCESFLAGESWLLDLHGHDGLKKLPKNILQKWWFNGDVPW